MGIIHGDTFVKQLLKVKRSFFRGFLLINIINLPALDSSAQPLSKKEARFVDSMMNANYSATEPGAVLLIAKNGKAVYRKGYGLANLELNVPNEPRYVFRIASMTKQFTAVGILKLAQERQLDLKADIKKYLPEYNTHGRHISLENVLSHTSGITDPQYKNEFIAKSLLDQSHDDLRNSFMNDSLLFEPGTDWSYSNSGYMVAGLIIEKVSGMPLSAYLHKNIFMPLGMTHTSVGNYDSVANDAVYGYFSAGGKRYKPIGTYSWSWQFACGDIISSVDDLLKWDNALYTEKIIKKEWLAKAWFPILLPTGASSHYGLGWTINDYHGLQIIEHAGGLQGFSSDAIRIPSQHLYIAILANRNTPWPPNIASVIALRLALPSLRDPAPETPEKIDIKDYEGVYAIHRIGVIVTMQSAGKQIYQQFTSRHDTLFAQFPGYAKSALMLVSKDVFRSGTQHFEFERDASKNINGVRIYNEPIQTGPDELQVKTALPLTKEKIAVTLSREQLELIKGKYDFSGGMILPVTQEGNKIYVQFPGEERTEVFAESDTTLFLSERDIVMEFLMAAGKVVGMNINIQGTKFEGRKIE